MRRATLCIVLVAAAGCGGNRAKPWPAVSAPAGVLAPLKTPQNPYSIIYHPAVDLAKRPDTTAAAPGKARR